MGVMIKISLVHNYPGPDPLLIHTKWEDFVQTVAIGLRGADWNGKKIIKLDVVPL